MVQTKTCPKCGAELPADAPAGICPKCLMQAGLASDQDAGSRPEMKPTTLTSGFVPPEPEELAKHFPKLEILELLGKGGMGAVYKARQPALDRLVAVKILPPEVGADPAFAERFIREARALAKLSHQNIVSIFDFGQADGLYYFIMEFVDGANLRHLIETGAITPEEALAIVPQICAALQFAHDEGIVHRDIKPENILLDKQGRVKIADFGLAKLLGSAADDIALTGTHQAMGTLHYMAPEQMQGAGSVDHRADIYSLGVVFYEMLTGQLPIGKFEPPSKKVQVDVRLDEIVLRALENEPERRYQNVSDVKTDVEIICGLPREAAQRIFGREYRSKTTVFGVPLVHIAFGLDPKTGRTRTAKGIIAIGDKAVGVVAFGGLALGVVAVGGVACGLFALGGAVLGILAAAGGLAVGGLSFGSMAVGVIAVGGGAIGVYAGGGWAWGMYVAAGSDRDPEAIRLFEQLPWARDWQHWVAGFGIAMPALGALVFLVIWLVFYRQNRRLQPERGDTGGRGGLSAREPTQALVDQPPVPPAAVGVADAPARISEPNGESIRQLLAGPVAALTLVAVAGLALGNYGIVSAIQQTIRHSAEGAGNAADYYLPAFTLCFAIILLIDVVKMSRCERYEWAVGGSVVAIVLAVMLAISTHAALLLAAAAGIWALIVLNRPDVKAAFAAKKKSHTPVP